MANYNKIKVLSELEHIRLRPGMYIGDTENPTHLFYEVFDNALDEAVSGHAKVISISLTPTSFSIMDDGRGIPQNWNEQYKMHDPVLVALKLHSGGKFDKDAYKISIGLNGIGLVACNALSDEMTIDTCREGKRFVVKFVSGMPQKPIVTDMGALPPYTAVTLSPSPKYFNTVETDKLAISNRLRLAVTFIKDLKITLNGDDVQPYTEKDLCPNCDTDVFQIDYKDGEEYVKCFLGYNTTVQAKSVNRGSVNLLEVNYGSHIRLFERALKDAWFGIIGAEDKKLIHEEDFLCGVRGFTLVQLLNPSYTSQTKDTLSGSVKNFNNLLNGLSKEISRVLQEKPKLVSALLNKFREYRKSLNRLSSSQYLDSVIEYGEEDSINRSIVLDSKLIDCISPDRDKTELYIVEGDSAGGGIIPLRDPNIHAVLPLRGKVMNVVDCDIKHILDNLEIRSLINAIGCGCLHRENVSKIRYQKIIVACDADVDGQNISALILGALCYLTPNVVKSGYVYIADMPLWGQRTAKTKEFRPIFRQQDLNPHWDTFRFKGLGSMDPEELFKSLLDPTFRRLNLVEVLDIRSVTCIVGSSEFRKKMLMRKGLVA